MLTAQLLANVRRIEIRTRRIVDQIAGGAYRSAFKGRGIEFREAREYLLEDDSRDIDWNLTARFGRPFVKLYTEERELTVMLIVDISASGDIGSGEKTKNQTAAELAALLALSASRNQDRVGLHLFTEQTEMHLAPRKGRKHALRLIRELLARPRRHPGTDISLALQQAIRTLHRRSVVFLISDMLDKDCLTPLMIAGHRHETIVARITDPMEISPPPIGWLAVEDAETGENLFFNGAGRRPQEIFIEKNRARRQNVEKQCRRAKADLIDFFVGQDVAKPLIGFFNQRHKSR